MTPERWQRVEEVLQAALDLPESERPAHLASVCSDDIELQREALSLLEAHEQAGDFLEQPAIEQDAHVLLGDDEHDDHGPPESRGRLRLRPRRHRPVDTRLHQERRSLALRSPARAHCGLTTWGRGTCARSRRLLHAGGRPGGLERLVSRMPGPGRR